MKRLKVSKKWIIFPTSWVEVSTEVWLRLMHIEDLSSAVPLFSAFTGESEEFFMKCKDPDLEYKIFAHLGWYTHPLDLKLIKLPSEVTIEDKVLKIPKDLGYETLGQKITLQQSLAEVKDNLSLAIPTAFAIYMMPRFTGEEFDAEKVDSFVEQYVKKLPIVTVYPIGSFFLKKLLDYLEWRVKDYSRLPIQMK